MFSFYFQGELQEIERDIYAYEGDYLADSSEPYGNIIEGWDEYFSRKKNIKNNDKPKKQKVKEDERLFSNSSVTYKAACAVNKNGKEENKERDTKQEEQDSAKQAEEGEKGDGKNCWKPGQERGKMQCPKLSGGKWGPPKQGEMPIEKQGAISPKQGAMPSPKPSSKLSPSAGIKSPGTRGKKTPGPEESNAQGQR